MIFYIQIYIKIEETIVGVRCNNNNNEVVLSNEKYKIIF